MALKRLVAAAMAVGIGLAVLSLWACSSLTDQAGELEQRGDLPGAEALYREILADDPDDLTALNGLASDLMLQKRYDEALPVQERVVSLDQGDAQTRIELGFNYLNHQEQPGKAVEVLRQAVALEPSAKHLTFLAQAETGAGDKAAAETTLRQAVEMQPDYVRAYAVLVDLLRSESRTAEAEAIIRDARARGLDTAELSPDSP